MTLVEKFISDIKIYAQDLDKKGEPTPIFIWDWLSTEEVTAYETAIIIICEKNGVDFKIESVKGAEKVTFVP